MNRRLFLICNGDTGSPLSLSFFRLFLFVNWEKGREVVADDDKGIGSSTTLLLQNKLGKDATSSRVGALCEGELLRTRDAGDPGYCRLSSSPWSATSSAWTASSLLKSGAMGTQALDFDEGRLVLASVSVCSVSCSFSSSDSRVLPIKPLAISRLCSFPLLFDKVLDGMDDADRGDGKLSCTRPRGSCGVAASRMVG